MRRRLKSVRAGEGRSTWSAFAMLFGLIGSHTLLETARDALFLSKIPATRLPLVYIAIAVVSLLVTEVQTRFSGNMSRRTALSVWTMFASLVTAVFWQLAGAGQVASLYALYIWSGMVTTLVLIHFWTLLGELFSITQAKRVYGVIAAGSALGAIVSSAIATAIASRVAPATLLLLAAVGFALTSLIPMLFDKIEKRVDVDDDPAATKRPGILASVPFILQKPYARRIVLLALLTAVTATLADFLFKATAAAAYHDPQELAQFFATVYLALNAASLFVQVAIAGALIRWLGVTSAVAVLPLFMTGSSFAMIIAAGLPAALALKGADGALKHSLHRTASELLYVPLSSAARASVKAFSDVVGQRGGQSLASGAILLLVAIGAPAWVFASLLTAAAALWLVLAVTARSYYVGLFRGRVLGNRVTFATSYPDLDVASLETLIATLDSDDDSKVVAAMNLLVDEDKARLIPALILYHPSPAVVTEALSVFAETGRESALHVIDKLIAATDTDTSIQVAAVGARAAIRFDRDALRAQLEREESPEVRAAIMANLVVGRAAADQADQDDYDDDEISEFTASILEDGTPPTKIAFAAAIGLRKAAGFDDVLDRLVADDDLDVRYAALEALEQLGRTETLVALLGDESLRATLSTHLANLGTAGVAAAGAALRSADTPVIVRRNIPRAMSFMEPEPAAKIMLAQLPAEDDGLVRYQIIRGLERLIARDPMLKLDKRALEMATRNTISRAYRYLDRRLSLERGANEQPERRTPGHALLVDMLDDKRVHAIERAFMLLALLRPEGDSPAIYRSVRSDREDLRSSGIELLENILGQPMRGALVGLVDDRPDLERLDAGNAFHPPKRLSYTEQLEATLHSSSDAVRDVTVYHIGELGLASFQSRLEELLPSSDEAARALSMVIAESEVARAH